MTTQRNVLGTRLEPCGLSPKTGFYRSGSCETDDMDLGRHGVCAEVTDTFLIFTQTQGNDLSSPAPEYGFPGLKAGDRWCLCAARWKAACEAELAPPVVLEATHEAVLEDIRIEDLERHALRSRRKNK